MSIPSEPDDIPLLSLAEVENHVREMAIGLVEEDGDLYRAGICLLACAMTGPSVIRLAKFTGYPEKFVATLARNWRANGIWVGRRRGRVVVTDMNDDTPPAEFTVSFWMHAMAGLGIMERVNSEEAAPEDAASAG